MTSDPFYDRRRRARAVLALEIIALESDPLHDVGGRLYDLGAALMTGEAIVDVVADDDDELTRAVARPARD